MNVGRSSIWAGLLLPPLASLCWGQGVQPGVKPTPCAEATQRDLPEDLKQGGKPFNPEEAIEICAQSLISHGATGAESKGSHSTDSPDAMVEKAYFLLHLNTASAADKAKAIDLLRKAAELNNANAEMELGVAYSRGNGVGKNMEEAKKWLYAAWKHGSGMAAIYVGMLDWYCELYPTMPRAQCVSVGRSDLSVAAADKNPEVAALGKKLFKYMTFIRPEVPYAEVKPEQGRTARTTSSDEGPRRNCLLSYERQWEPGVFGHWGSRPVYRCYDLPPR